MQWSTVKRIALFSLFFLLAMLLLQFGRAASGSQEEHGLSSEKVNLALRRTAHYLLLEAGDSTSRILPVQQITDSSWLIGLPHSFNYNALPGLLQASFDLHGIRENYDVAILRCSDGELQLGYSYLDYEQNNDVPCGGRDMGSDCYEMQVSFSHPAIRKDGLPAYFWYLAIAGLLAAAFALGWKKRRLPDTDNQQTAGATPDWLQFGNSRLDTANHSLVCNGKSVQLTYREAKLLQLFARHPNQVLQRDFIMENVWADEGILVGRSLDVFVSRLRKKLLADPALGIAAVHGIGYRLEDGVLYQK